MNNSKINNNALFKEGEHLLSIGKVQVFDSSFNFKNLKVSVFDRKHIRQKFEPMENN